MTKTGADEREPNWRKSSYSVANGQCVRVATVPGMVAIADSAEPAAGILLYPAQAWRLFTSDVRDGQIGKS